MGEGISGAEGAVSPVQSHHFGSLRGSRGQAQSPRAARLPLYFLQAVCENRGG